MRPPGQPNERERLAGLEATGLFYTPAEERFDRVTRLATHLLGAPIALLSLIGETRQFMKSSQGMIAIDVPREATFCNYAMTAGDTLIVEDASHDARFAENPFVTGEPHVRAYAGNVIHTPDGQAVGTLCVIDRKPRKFTEAEIACLADLAAIAQDELARQPQGVHADFLRRLDEARRRESLDPASRLLAHEAMLELLLGLAAKRAAFSLILVRVPQLAALSTRIGAEGAAEALRDVASRALRALSPRDAAGRFDDVTFVVVAPDTSALAAADRAARICGSIAGHAVQAGPLSVRLSANVATRTAAPGESVAAMLESALAALGGTPATSR